MGAPTAGPKWKREKVQDHKFDYVDVDEFHDPSCLTRTKYMLLFLVVLKSVLVYAADMWTAVSLLVVGSTTTLSEIDIGISIDVSKYIFLGAILISFLLLFWDIRKGRTIVASRDISYTFTSVFASRYYSLKDYNYYCFFCKIQNSKKTTDEIAFFVFFTLKGWKRLLLAEAPRQVINAVTLYALLKQWIDNNHSLQLQSLLDSMSKDVIAKMMTYTMAFSFVIFVISFFMICVAAILYIPLLCHIQGNLKEYCCHKVDKRISELLKKQAKKRQAKGGRQGKGPYHDTTHPPLRMPVFRRTWDIIKQMIPTLRLIIPLYYNMHKNHLADVLQANRLQGVRIITPLDMTITAHKRHDTLVNSCLHLQDQIVLYIIALELHLRTSTRYLLDTKIKHPIIHKQTIEAIKAE
ncbi:hypothetical protein K450DRAFT_263315 [Umbelopsis ramanniana AG]|uniref:Uncharacterized protein n=1 Tax=Umbelopsis ramanniana AG TaxID=1314678 RepID=A0AAD5E138_UMBRA|nr:uncharacterized protein K450DRAFT_263315 [Umbelopsis ramanniana AG]KAI8575092.1 hypothetical protein K450DRAFT_263315 [Umbelopsis ramanniana AG]